MGGRDKITTANSGAEPAALAELLKEFHAIRQRIEKSSAEADIKEDLQTNVKRIEGEVKEGSRANPTKVERWLMKIGAMSDDIFQVTAAALVNPVYRGGQDPAAHCAEGQSGTSQTRRPEVSVPPHA